MNKSFQNAGVELLGIVPRIDVVGRGSIPEVEIRYEEFGAKAIEMAEQHMDLDRIAAIAAPASRNPGGLRGIRRKIQKSARHKLRISTQTRMGRNARHV